MGGGLLQLVAYGAQDAYITGNPQITFWKSLFKRHTNFAMEPFRVNFSGQSQWGTKQTAIVGRHADLLYSTYIQVELPRNALVSGTLGTTSGSIPYAWNNDQNSLGFNLVKYAEIDIGGQVIDRLYGEWMHVWSSLSKPTDQRDKLRSLLSEDCVNAGSTLLDNGYENGAACGSTGRQGARNIFYIPLEFFFTKNPGAALPLIALQYHEVKINIYWNDPELIAGNFTNRTVEVFAGQDNNGDVVLCPPISAIPFPINAAIYIDYIYLDTEERRRMAQASHEYLIEQTQFNEEKGIVGSNNRIDLTFNHPVKELVWVVQPSFYRDCRLMAALSTTSADANQTQSFSALTADFTTGGGDGSATYNISYSAGNTTYTISRVSGGSSGYTTSSVLTFLGTSLGGLSPENDLVITVTTVSVSDTITGETRTGRPSSNTTFCRLLPFTYNEDPINQQWIQINGQDRLDKRFGNYFSRVQSYQHHSGISAGIGVYS
jgi:hypothetical protein